MLQPWSLVAQTQVVAPATGVRFARIQEQDLREWLTYLSSDELQGRQIYTEGYGLASAYVADRLKAWGVKPLGTDGAYYQPVHVRGYNVTRKSSVTVTVDGESKTFTHGDHVTFPVTSGGQQTVTFDRVEFVGYGLTHPASGYDDYRERDVRNRLVVSVAGRPKALGDAPVGRLTGNGYALSLLGAGGAIAYAAPPATPTPADAALARAQTALSEATAAVAEARAAGAGRGGGGRGGAGRGGPAGRGGTAPSALTTTANVEDRVAPQIMADDTFYEWLFSRASTSFADIKAAAGRGDELPAVALPNVSVTFTIDNAFDQVSAQRTRNVVGMVEGTDPTLKGTYVLLGAHLDHIGYSQTGMGNGPAPGACRLRSVDALAALQKAGRTPQNTGQRGGGPPAAPADPFERRDVIYNGADDDGSGSVSLLAIAKAFATGAKPRRSVVFMWHAGEEGGLLGSRYNAGHPAVPLDAVQAHINLDMIGRDDCNNVEGDYTNSVFVIGADRISTDLHNVIVGTNDRLAAPLMLDFEMNDPKDPESVYTRSDHFSYASKGIPVAFFTTGLHPDYHRVSDTIEKINFPKMTRITQLVYQAGWAIANSPGTLARDNRGPRTGFGSASAPLPR
jgi:hypothetical protein